MGLFVGVLAALIVFYTQADAWMFGENKTLDCLVTDWSEWHISSNDGAMHRGRRILRHPTGNGATCPTDLEQIIYPDTDCEVSQWSEWSGNFGFGQQSRQRAVTRNPHGAGMQCPALEEVIYTGKAPTVEVTAKSVSTYFIRPNGNGLHLERRQAAEIGSVRDLLLIMDSSGSIGWSGFTKANAEISRLLGLLCPVDTPFDRIGGNINQYNQAAMLTFSSQVYKNFDFKDYNTTRDVQIAISKAKYYGRGTNTAEAFRRAKTLFESSTGVRDDKHVKHEVLILTDGQSNDRVVTLAAVELLREKADVYGLIIGTFSMEGIEELTKYVSSPVNEHLFYVEHLRDLTTLVDYVEEQRKTQGQHWCAPFDLD